jgi:CarboxypepD_reg-like domain
MKSVAACALIAFAAGSAAQAQTPSSRTITGTVVDSANHKPLSQAVIYIGRTPTGQRTGNDGKFRISADSGPHVLMLRHWGYVPAFVVVPNGSADTADAGTTSLRQVKTDQDRAAVENADVQAFPELATFYDHKANYRMGLFLTPDELQRVGGSLFNLIRQKANFHFICFMNRKGEVDCGQEASRGRTSIMNPNPTSREQEPCLMEVWTNAYANAMGMHSTLDQFQMDEVLAVEAYPNPGVTPPDFGGSPCAAVMLWMKQAASNANVGTPR